jgi:hypothetical protein
LLHFLRRYDEGGVRTRIQYRVIELSTGDALMEAYAPREEEHLFSSDSEDRKEEVEEIEPWRWIRVTDQQRIDSWNESQRRTEGQYCMGPKGIPASKRADSTYEEKMDQYEYMVRKSHGQIAKKIAQVYSGPIVVPGDGVGRFKSMWPSKCQSSDVNITEWTHPGVEKKTLTEVIASDPEDPLILMYVWYALTDQDKLLLRSRQEMGRRTLIIDTRPEVDVGRKVNNMVYEIGFPDLELPFFDHDTPEKVYGIKFSKELLSLKNPCFQGDSHYKNYFFYMKPFFKREGEEDRVSLTIASYLQTDRQGYLVLAGRKQVPVLPMVLGARQQVRTIYYLPLSQISLIPSTLHREIIGDRVYFLSYDVETTHHYFRGLTREWEYSMAVKFYDLTKPGTVMDLFRMGAAYDRQEIERSGLCSQEELADRIRKGHLVECQGKIMAKHDYEYIQEET